MDYKDDIKDFFAQRALSASQYIVKYREKMAAAKTYSEKESWDRCLAFFEGQMIRHANEIINRSQ